MTSEKWKRWSTLPDPHVAYFNGKQLKLSAENTETSEQSLEMACGNQQCFEFNPVVLSATIILPQSTWSNSVTCKLESVPSDMYKICSWIPYYSCTFGTYKTDFQWTHLHFKEIHILYYFVLLNV